MKKRVMMTMSLLDQSLMIPDLRQKGSMQSGGSPRKQRRLRLLKTMLTHLKKRLRMWMAAVMENHLTKRLVNFDHIYIPRLIISQDDDLTNHQCGADLEEKLVKKDSTHDLLTIMSDRVTVRFKVADEEYVEEKGRWCNPCK